MLRIRECLLRYLAIIQPPPPPFVILSVLLYDNQCFGRARLPKNVTRLSTALLLWEARRRLCFPLPCV